MDKNSEQYKKLVEKMQDCIDGDDYEDVHYEADNILCKLLRELGYTEIVEMFEEVGKWYS